MHVTANSKEVRPGSIFFALKGAKFDGHDFIDLAFEAGASQVFAERDAGNPKVTVLGDQTRMKLAEMASEMYGLPTHSLKMIGVTGTSGKTTTTYLIHHLLNECGIRTARLGTNGTYFEGSSSETANTTPDALTLQKFFRDVMDQGAEAVVMEVSSHALDQERVWGIAWDRACFLNLSPEHMDYHPNLDHYFSAKSKLFTTHREFSQKCGKAPQYFSSADNPFGQMLLKNCAWVKESSVKRQVNHLTNVPNGIEFEVELKGQTYPASCPLFGSFQIENILAALNIVVSMGISPKTATEALRNFPGVPGRMEFIQNSKGLYVFVDYAHKPEALEKVLLALQPENKYSANSAEFLPPKIYTVFGCGGDRDKTKRPIMGEIATRLSHFAFLTSDNPRTEDPLQILKDVEAGITKTNYKVIPDRATAIEEAILSANPGDIVLIAGKGHEDYQIIGTTKRHFDDREEARKHL